VNSCPSGTPDVILDVEACSKLKNAENAGIQISRWLCAKHFYYENHN
jgi:hypothetical protein